ncbi:hypothetical protein [Haloarcula sp. K1]|uniref:hypothetical protein n=1 Tax=Haloarcula sp. K1 TaxID=1622207 RepID=UPI0007BB2325|nr:hypothetical protein [Haloarcula sp. K1]KZX46273.1 hypothetical protein AV929_16000 [Haloarcula sp. K1]
MTTEPLHTHSETHLYGDSFEEFAAGRITEGDEVLVAAPTDEITTSIIDQLESEPGISTGSAEAYLKAAIGVSGDETEAGHRESVCRSGEGLSGAGRTTNAD